MSWATGLADGRSRASRSIVFPSSRRRGVSPASYTANRMLDEPPLMVSTQRFIDLISHQYDRQAGPPPVCKRRRGPAARCGIIGRHSRSRPPCRLTPSSGSITARPASSTFIPTPPMRPRSSRHSTTCTGIRKGVASRPGIPDDVAQIFCRGGKDARGCRCPPDRRPLVRPSSNSSNTCRSTTGARVESRWRRISGPSDRRRDCRAREGLLRGERPHGIGRHG